MLTSALLISTDFELLLGRVKFWTGNDIHCACYCYRTVGMIFYEVKTLSQREISQFVCLISVPHDWNIDRDYYLNGILKFHS